MTNPDFEKIKVRAVLLAALSKVRVNYGLVLGGH